MKLLFIDTCGWAYDTTTPNRQPLGGAQSAMVYLTMALARMGHAVYVINETRGPRDLVTDGVHFIGLPLSLEETDSFDAIVSSNNANAVAITSGGCRTPLVLWSHHASDQASIQALAEPRQRDLFAGYVLLTQWQADTYIEAFHLDPAKIRIIRNAASPAFHRTEREFGWLAQGRPPVLAYTSTPYRGLDILLLAFPMIREKLPGATLRIFSSMGIYDAGVWDPFTSLYALARTMPGVEYVGPLPQPELAREMARIDIWAYPSTFAETSCVSALEAMASGAFVVSTALGALPETTAGFAQLMPPLQTDFPGAAATHFATHLLNAVETAERDKAATLARLREQVEFTRAGYDWDLRAREWTLWLQQILKR
jgi:glycosyltransferase involved in cell wall biosynthesis